jgi:orotidine-5'-phosphate decarboxylase
MMPTSGLETLDSPQQEQGAALSDAGRTGTSPSMFAEKLREAQRLNNSFLCVGLDPDPGRMAQTHIPSFFADIIEETKDLVCAYKPNLAFFEALGMGGMQLMLESLRAVPKHIPIIADAKRGDIGNTARFYAKAIFDVYKFDACTVNPYGGRDAILPFLERPERTAIVWCRSSNDGASDLQDLELKDGRYAYEAVAEMARELNTQGNVGVVAGATWPEQIERVRAICPDQVMLVPGVGDQSGALEAAVEAAMDAEGGGFLINASRSVIYASRKDDYAAAARKQAQHLRNRINVMREAAGARG